MASTSGPSEKKFGGAEATESPDPNDDQQPPTRRRREGQQHTGGLCIESMHDGPVRASIIVRLFVEYALERDGPSTDEHAAIDASAKHADNSEMTPEAIGRSLADRSIVDVAEQWRVEQTLDTALRYQTPSLEKSGDGGTLVQQQFERVVVASLRIQREQDTRSTEDIIFMEGSRSQLRRLFPMAVRLYRLLFSTTCRSDVVDVLEQLPSLHAEARPLDMKLASMLVRDLFDVPLVLRYCHLVPKRLRLRNVINVDCAVGIGSRRAADMAERSSMRLQADAVQSMEQRHDRYDLLTVRPVCDRGSRGRGNVSPMWLASSIRDCVPTAREGVDFVILWTPDSTDKTAAMLVTRKLWTTVSTVGSMRAHANEQRPSVERALSVARVFNAYARRDASAEHLAQALRHLSALLGHRGIDRSNDEGRLFSVDRAPAALERLERVLALYAGSCAQLVDVLYNDKDDQCRKLEQALVNVLMPRSQALMMAMPSKAGREYAGDWVTAGGDAARQLWRRFFWTPRTGAAVYRERRNDELHVTGVHQQLNTAERTAISETCERYYRPFDDGIDTHIDINGSGGVRGRKRPRNEEDSASVAQQTFHSVAIGGVPFALTDATLKSHFGVSAVMRSAPPQWCVDAEMGEAHLHLIDTIMRHSKNASVWLGEVYAMRTNERPNRECVRVPLPAPHLATMGGESSGAGEELANFRVTAATLAVVVGCIRTSTTRAACERELLRQLRSIEREQRSMETVSSTGGESVLPTTLSLVPSELASDYEDCGLSLPTRIMTEFGLPRPLIFGQRRLVAGATLNFFHTVAGSINH
jgi:hypothetical protein